MEHKIGRRILAMLLAVCLLAGLYVPQVTVEAQALDLSSLTCSSYISNATARSYIDTMMKYYINNNSTLQSMLTSGKCVIFMFEGGSDNYWSGGSTYEDSIYDNRIQSVVFVVKQDASGKAYIDFCSETCSSIPTQKQYHITLDGIYRVYRWNHTGPYAAFQLACYSGLYVADGYVDGYIHSSSGINIHTRSTTSGSDWSAGCHLVGNGAYTANEFNKFFQSVSGINGNPWTDYYGGGLYSYSELGGYGSGSDYTVGYYVVDRQLGMIAPDGTERGSGSLASIYTDKALDTITAYSTTAAQAAGALDFEYSTSQCTYYPAHCQVKVTNGEMYVNSQPCSISATYNSVAMEQLVVGKTYTATGLFKNHYGNYWYRVLTDDGQVGYIYGDNVDYLGEITSDITLTGATAPNGHVAGKSFIINGTLSAQYSGLHSVGCYVFPGFASSGTYTLGATDPVSNNRYSLAYSNVDNNIAMGSLATGNYTYVIHAAYTNYHTTDATDLQSVNGTLEMMKSYFAVVSASTDQSTCSHSYTTTTLGAADCTQAGTQIQSCTKCGKVVTTAIAAGSHSYGEWATTQAPTCTASGTQTRSCTKCGVTQTQSVSATSHSYQLTASSATCTDGGTATYTCSSCGDSYTEAQSATGHSYDPERGFCTGCGLLRQESVYYLTGTINGVTVNADAIAADPAAFETFRFDENGVLEITLTEAVDDMGICCFTSGTHTYASTFTDYSYLTGAGDVTFWLTYVGNINMDWCVHQWDGGQTVKQGACGDPTVIRYTCTGTTIDGHPCTNTKDVQIPTDHTYAQGVCTGCGLVCQHDYVDRVCTVCGMAEPALDYYLFGWINGVNYACEENYEDLGIYRFVDGQLIATFESDSYVAVKTGDNANWYMTLGYPGNDVTSTTLYDTSITGDSSDKLFVPGGREITFTLVENGDGSLTLRYEAAVCLHPSHGTDGSCTLCGQRLVHTYCDNVCSVCGLEKPVKDHYLFGFINGADYASADDYENIGIYKFVDGQLTVMFDETSYVAVKSGDNADWYMAQGYPGDQATATTLYNTAAYEAANEKLCVPGGVRVTFTLVDNGDDTYSLRYEIAPAVAPTLTLNYPSLSFEEEIKYNVYFTATDLVDVVEMGLITLPGKLADATIADAIDVLPNAQPAGSLYMAHTNGIAACNMGDALYFKVYAKLTDGTYVYSSVAGYNAVAYANTIFKNSGSDEMKALAVAMLNYGAEAQKFFGHNVDSLMNASLTAEQQALVSGYDETMVDPVVGADSNKTGAFVQDKSGFTALKPTVSFDGAFAINYYFTTAYEANNGMTLYYWTAQDYAAADMLSMDNATGSFAMTPTDMENEFWGKITDIAAADLDQTVYVTAFYTARGVTYCTGVIAYHVGRYCEGVAANTGSAMQPLAAATATYGYYAKTYFGSLA